INPVQFFEDLVRSGISREPIDGDVFLKELGNRGANIKGIDGRKLLQDLASRGVKMPNSIVVGSTATGAQEQSATSPGSAPEASATLKRFHDHISDATELDFDTKVLVQRKFGEGTTQAMATFLTRRPNLFRIHAEVKGRKYVVISDGWTVTIYR